MTNNFVCDKYKEYIKQAKAPSYDRSKSPFTILVDLDGTVAFSTHREWWENEKVKDDQVNHNLIKLIDTFYQHPFHCVIYLTGRDESCRYVTESWMKSTGIAYDFLIMRPEGNTDKDDDLKEALYREHIEGHYNVIAVFEDRPLVIKRFREMGLFVLDVNQINNFKEIF